MCSDYSESEMAINFVFRLTRLYLSFDYVK